VSCSVGDGGLDLHRGMCALWCCLQTDASGKAVSHLPPGMAAMNPLYPVQARPVNDAHVTSQPSVPGPSFHGSRPLYPPPPAS
jgi:hypothetical protein